MDRHALAIPIPVLFVAFTGLTVFSYTPLGRAITRRPLGAGPELEERVAALESEADATRRRDARAA